MVDISERLDLEARLLATSNEQLGFQRLIADIASRLVQVPPDDVDTAINESLREVGEALQVDSVVVWQAGRGESAAVASHYWVAPPHASPPEPYLTADLPWVFSNIESGEACWFTRIDDVPDAVDRETLATAGPALENCLPADAPRRRSSHARCAGVQLDVAGARVGALHSRAPAPGRRRRLAGAGAQGQARRRSTRPSRKSAT